MKVNHFQISISMMLTTVFIFHAGCQGVGEAGAPSQMAKDETPSQMATRNFMQSLNVHEIDRAVVIDRQVQEKESRTSVFQKSLIKYVKEIYNRKDYALALSQDGSHILQFMDLSNELNLGAETVLLYMRLFCNKAKECEVVDDAMIIQLLKGMPSRLERHFISEHEDDQANSTDLSFIKHHIESTLLAKFTEHLPSFQSEPDVFISNLAQDLALYQQQEMDRATKQKNNAEARERLRTIIIKFFDLGLNKVMWSPETYQNPWESFNAIANGLSSLAQHGIVKHMDDLDDLFWSLIHRFCFFLDLAGASLPIDLYEEIEHDLDNGSVQFLETKEQDEGITSKKEILFESLLQAKARAFAYERGGIISMPMMTRSQENMTVNNMTMNNENKIEVGKIYQHYSGKEYRVLGFSRHSETLEEMVIYQGLYDCPKFGPNPIWVRPKAMFIQHVEVGGVKTPRFKVKQLEQCP